MSDEGDGAYPSTSDDLFIPPASPTELDALEAAIDGWLNRALAENPMLVAVDRGEPGERRWYVRLAGEDKDFTTIWFTLRQRALHFERSPSGASIISFSAFFPSGESPGSPGIASVPSTRNKALGLRNIVGFGSLRHAIKRP